MTIKQILALSVKIYSFLHIYNDFFQNMYVSRSCVLKKYSMCQVIGIDRQIKEFQARTR